MIMYRFTVLLEILGGNISYCFVAARNSSLSFCIQGACMVRGACMVKRGMLDKGGHAGKGKCVAKGIMCGKGVCMVKGGCAQGACMAGAVQGGGMHSGGDAWWEVTWWGGACMAREMATAVDGMHPTGMHSCFLFVWKMVILSANAANNITS